MLKLTFLFPIFLALLFSQITNLSGLIFISMVLQSGAIINIMTPLAEITGTDGYGLSPFHGVAFVIVIVGFFNFLKNNNFFVCHNLRTPLIFFLAYTIWSAIGSFVWPFIFNDLMVNSLIKMYGVSNLTTLTWNLSHIVQAITLMLLFALLLSILFLCNSTLSKKKFLYGFIISYFFVFFIGIYEQTGRAFDFPSLSGYIATNIGYHQAPTWAGNSFSSLERIGLPFSEPSYASVYMAAVFMGCVVSSFFGSHWFFWMVASLFSLLGLINTLGSTGLAAAIIAFLFMGLCIISSGIKCINLKNNKNRNRAVVFLFLLITFFIIFLVIYKFTSFGYQIQIMFKGLILDKALGTDGSTRGLNNLRAFQILIETYGMGAGMGSHRASSYFASLLANTGLFGFIFFLGMLSTLLWRYWNSLLLSDTQIFVAAALCTASLGMGLGIPDLNMPMYWGFIFLGFVFCPGNVAHEKGAGDGSPAARV